MNCSNRIFVLVEEMQGRDEGSDIFCAQMTKALRDYGLVTHRTTPASNGSSVLSPVVRFAAMLEAPRHPQPKVVLYVPTSRMVTVPALFRARLLGKLMRAPVAMIAFHETLPASSRILAKKIKPDLLLLTTEKECRVARECGLRAELIWTGADTERFRPAQDGEKGALREKWGLSAHNRIVLHVGHLFENRNLRALIPLASAPGVSVVVVTSSLRRFPESSWLERSLQEGGVTVLTGFQPNIEEIYRMADCYVFPTVSVEGAVAVPLSVIEARASGLPVVSRRFRALAEPLGLRLGVQLVDSDEELVTRTLALVQGPAFELGPIPEDFSWSGVARRIMDVLEGARPFDNEGCRPIPLHDATSQDPGFRAARQTRQRRGHPTCAKTPCAGFE